MRRDNAHAAEFPTPLRRNLEWRIAFACDLDHFPAQSYAQGRLRLAQRAGIARWPATALVDENETSVMIVSTIPIADEFGFVQQVGLWAVVSPDLAARGVAVARACRRLFARLTRAAHGKPIVIWVDEENMVARDFAWWLGFVPVGHVFVAPVNGVTAREWRWTT